MADIVGNEGHTRLVARARDDHSAFIGVAYDSEGIHKKRPIIVGRFLVKSD